MEHWLLDCPAALSVICMEVFGRHDLKLDFSQAGHRAVRAHIRSLSALWRVCRK